MLSIFVTLTEFMPRVAIVRIAIIRIPVVIIGRVAVVAPVGGVTGTAGKYQQKRPENH
jgi:hypothetical protein